VPFHDDLAVVAGAIGIDDADIALRRRFLGCTGTDLALLEQIHEALQPHIGTFVDAFYDHLDQFQQMRALAPDGPIRDRLKRAQTEYFHQLTSAGCGIDYAMNRLRVGLAHQRAGLAPTWYLGAYCRYLTDLLPLLIRHFGEDDQRFLAVSSALFKAVFFDMGLAIDTYIHVDKLAISQLESQLRNLVDGIDAIVWEADGQLDRHGFVSDQARTMLGYSPQQWLDQRNFWQTLIVEEDRDGVVTRRHGAIAAGQDHELEYRVRTADGRVLWIQERVSLVRDGSGTVSSLRGLMIDISRKKLAEQEKQRLLAIVESTTDLVAIFDLQHRLHFINGAGRTRLGIPADQEVLSLPVSVCLPAALALDVVLRAMPKALAEGSWAGESVLDTADGRSVPVSLVVLAHKGDDGDIEFCSAIIRDIAQFKATESQLRILNRAIESSPYAVSITDASLPDGPLIYVNPAFERITGYLREEVLGRNCRFLQGNDLDQPELEEIRQALRESRGGYAVLRNYRKDGSMFWNELFVSPVHDEAGRTTHYIGVQNDISSRRKAEEGLIYLANHDELTGLPNRTLLQDRMRQAMARVHRDGGSLAILFIDLDRFKNINDSLGHEIGDAVLRTTAARLTACLREADTVARLGGDEFILMLSDIHRMEDVTTIGQKVLATLAQPIGVDGHELFVTGSIGVSLYPKDGNDFPSLLRNADTAMYRAKEKGKNRVQFYAEEMNTWANKRLFIETRLRQALEQREFVLHYQPQVDLDSGRICGAEALVRWNDPDMGLIAPTDFIPIAEETGLIVPLGQWVLETACSQATIWHHSGYPGLRIAVNLSARQLASPALAETIEQILAKTGMDPRWLELELTETLLIQPDEISANNVNRLSRMGIRFSLDDFGTGYSALGYLNRFPLSSVKIDRSFVADVTRNPRASALTRSIISMAHELRLRVIAEGVETENQLLFLAGRDCDEVQGYFFGAPVPAAQFEELLHSCAGRLWLNRPGADGREPTVLFFDPNSAALAQFKTLLVGEGYRIMTASSAHQAWNRLAEHQAAVIVASSGGTPMNAVDFLARAQELYPKTVRVLLADADDAATAESLIDRGVVNRVLGRPWDWSRLQSCLLEALQRAQLERENRHLAEQIERANHDLFRVQGYLEQCIDQVGRLMSHNMDILMSQESSKLALPWQTMDRLPLGFVALDHDARIAYANPWLDRLLGTDSAAALIGRPIGECFLAPLLDWLRRTQTPSDGDSHALRLDDGRVIQVRCYRHDGLARPIAQVLLLSEESPISAASGIGGNRPPAAAVCPHCSSPERYADDSTRQSPVLPNRRST
jgi:diguanylate cyclase (GGDEF)-like protein/PAS domain S-box-containing protein